MNDIVIRLHPYEIFGGFNTENKYEFDFVIDSKKIIGIDDVLWCCLPDILVEGSDSRFIGLSFSVINEYVDFVQKIVNVASDQNCRLISSLDNVFESRYQGFGSNSRLELYWENPSGEVNCEFASLYSGCWLYADGVDRTSTATAWPIGYWLSEE